MDAIGLFGIFGLYFIAIVIYLFTIIGVYRDAEETYGTGLFWGLCVIIVPLLAVPVYLLMRVGTHRSVNEDLAAWKRRERQSALGYRHSGTVMDLSKDLQEEVRWGDGNDGYTISSAPAPKDFKPFTHTFSESAERLRKARRDSEHRGDSG